MKKLSDEKKCLICFALVIIMGLLLFYTYIGDNEDHHDGIIRLHVIANSDDSGDQALKLKVRDAVIGYMEKQEQLHSADETESYLKDNLDRFEKIAEGVIASEGYDYTANADLGIRYIPEKTYGDITFPAGNYEALNITIGKGEGQNWWCVLFPPLCLLDEGTDGTSAETDADTSAGDDANAEPSADTNDDPVTRQQRLELRWKLLEILRED